MKIKAIALFSGGLDSILAAKLIKEEKVKVEALHFNNPFSPEALSQKKSFFARLAAQLKIKLTSLDLDSDYLEAIQNPKYGCGKNLNPCIDCRIHILEKAKEYMKKTGAVFLITGEVLGQRPMSQYRRALATIEKASRLEKLVLRPLSARLLWETIPEEKGWVKRSNLLAISGRSRKEQLRLAEKFEIKDYFWAAGGCLLADANFSRRFADIAGKNRLALADIELLKIGRHFRLTPFFKLIVGRNAKENAKLEELKRESDFIFSPQDVPGPTGLGRGKIDEPLRDLCAKIIAGYSSKEKVKINFVNDKEKIKQTLIAQGPLEEPYKTFII